MDEQVNQPRHRHVPTTVQKRVFERFIMGLNPVVCVVVQLPPHTECLDPHLQINKKKQFLLQSRRNIYTLGHHDTSLYLLFRSPLIGVIIPKVRESRPHMRLLQDHQCFGVPIFHFHVTHRSQKCHTVHLIVANSVFRWFKFTLKPPYSIAHDKLRLAIWDTSFWTFWLKFGHKGP